MQASVGVVLVIFEQFADQRFALCRWKLRFTELAQAQNQRATNGYVGFHAQTRDDRATVRAFWPESVDKIAPHARVGTVTQERPDLVGLARPQQRHGGVGLPLRESLLRIVPGIVGQLHGDFGRESRKAVVSCPDHSWIDRRELFFVGVHEQVGQRTRIGGVVGKEVRREAALR